jgi:16S rRNA C967 or C1407 C5-methylase (RsmB/RsmF family)
MKRDSRAQGPEAFEEYYSRQWGERWPRLRGALLGEAEPLPWSAGLKTPYSMDPASILAAMALGRPRGQSCLDLCAAPGGKTLVIASRMEDSSLLANERSIDRFHRLKRVLDEHAPDPLRASIKSRHGDGAALCRSLPEAFDLILLDAPCSSERHVLGSETHLGIWSPRRLKALPVGQWALLSSAFLMLKPGGRLTYSTCSLNPAENEGIAARLFHKYGDRAVEADPLAILREEIKGTDDPMRRRFESILSSAERAERGILILPDRCDGAGPMYIAIFEKS